VCASFCCCFYVFGLVACFDFPEPFRNVVAPVCRYVRALGALYLRLVGKALEIYTYLEPLYNDFRKLRVRQGQGWSLTTMDQFIESLLTQETVCDIALPFLLARDALVKNGSLEVSQVHRPVCPSVGHGLALCRSVKRRWILRKWQNWRHWTPRRTSLTPAVTPAVRGKMNLRLLPQCPRRQYRQPKM
jgi:PRP38 family